MKGKNSIAPRSRWGKYKSPVGSEASARPFSQPRALQAGASGHSGTRGRVPSTWLPPAAQQCPAGRCSVAPMWATSTAPSTQGARGGTSDSYRPISSRNYGCMTNIHCSSSTRQCTNHPLLTLMLERKPAQSVPPSQHLFTIYQSWNANASIFLSHFSAHHLFSF